LLATVCRTAVATAGTGTPVTVNFTPPWRKRRPANPDQIPLFESASA
jgi:hypothetical protein